jgi:hypothetical protein
MANRRRRRLGWGRATDALGEILDAWFAGEPSAAADDLANIEHLRAIERDLRA